MRRPRSNASEEEVGVSFQLPPERYREILEGLEFTRLELEVCSMKSTPDACQSGNRRVHVDDSEAGFERMPDGSVAVWHSSALRAKVGRAVVFRLDATFRLFFSSEHEFSDEFFEIFRSLNLSLHTWPYFRELLSNLSSRTSTPTLMLPLLKSP